MLSTIGIGCIQLLAVDAFNYWPWMLLTNLLSDVKLLKSAQFSGGPVVVEAAALVFTVADSSNLAQLSPLSPVLDDGCWISHGDAVSMATGVASIATSGQSVTPMKNGKNLHL